MNQLELDLVSKSPINTEALSKQARQIYQYMISGNRINPVKARKLFGCNHLHSRIPEIKKYLEKQGIKIERQFIKVKESTVREYWISSVNAG